MRDDVFRREVVRVAETAGVPVPPVEVRRRVAGKAAARRRGRGADVRVGSAVLSAPAGVQRFFAAHEVGHIALGHVYRRRSGALWAGVLVAGVGLMFLALSVTTFPQPHPLVQPVAPVAAVVAVGLLCVSFIPVRRQERAADVFAGEVGAPLTSEVVEWALDNGRQPRRTPTWMLDHPKWHDRLRHVREQADAGVDPTAAVPPRGRDDRRRGDPGPTG